MRRREFIALLGGAAVAWPLAVHAQQPAMPVIGFLSGLGSNDRVQLVEAFRQGLKELGYIEGRSIAIEYRFAENQLDRLPALAADLVRRQVAVIAATGGNASNSRPRRNQDNSHRIHQWGRPGRCRSGRESQPAGSEHHRGSFFAVELGSKAMGLLLELVPAPATFALLINPNNPEGERQPARVQEAARALGRQLVVARAARRRDRRRLRDLRAAADGCAPCRR